MNRATVMLMALALVGCGSGSGSGGGGGGGGSGLTEVQTFHPNGQLKEHGWTDASGAKTSAWNFYFDNGQVQWQGSYANDAVDDAKLWREWNRDGSVRDDSTDAVPSERP